MDLVKRLRKGLESEVAEEEEEEEEAEEQEQVQWRRGEVMRVVVEEAKVFSILLVKF